MYSHRINDWLLFDMAINVCYLFKNYTHRNHFWKWNYHSDTSTIRIILSAWRSSLACFKLRGQQKGVSVNTEFGQLFGKLVSDVCVKRIDFFLQYPLRTIYFVPLTSIENCKRREEFIP